MKYDDLPMAYKDYCESEGWEEADALHHWNQASQYRKYVEDCIQESFRIELHMHGMNNRPGGISDTLMLKLRGSRINFT